MKNLLIAFIALISINAFGNAQDIANTFNVSSTPTELVESGWAGNDGGKGYKVSLVPTHSVGTRNFHVRGTIFSFCTVV